MTPPLTLALKLVFAAGYVGAFAIRWIWVRRAARGSDRKRRGSDYGRMEWPALILDTVFRHAMPLIYLFTPWLAFADYGLPVWTAAAAGAAGAAVFAGALWLLWRSHADLARNWSPMVEVRDGQTLVTDGVYSRMRNPMYLAHLLWSIAQALLLQNWIAGFAAPFAFLPFMLVRIPAEERVLSASFGGPYAEWSARTGRVLPRFR